MPGRTSTRAKKTSAPSQEPPDLEQVMREGTLKDLTAALAAGADANSTDEGGRAVLWLAVDEAASALRVLDKRSVSGLQQERANATLKFNTKRIQALLAAGANPNARDRYGRTPIMCLCTKRGIPVVRALAEAGADLDAEDGFGNTALVHAERRSEAAAKALTELGAKSLGSASQEQRARGRAPDVAALLPVALADLPAEPNAGSRYSSTSSRVELSHAELSAIYDLYLDYWNLDRAMSAVASDASGDLAPHEFILLEMPAKYESGFKRFLEKYAWEEIPGSHVEEVVEEPAASAVVPEEDEEDESTAADATTEKTPSIEELFAALMDAGADDEDLWEMYTSHMDHMGGEEIEVDLPDEEDVTMSEYEFRNEYDGGGLEYDFMRWAVGNFRPEDFLDPWADQEDEEDEDEEGAEDGGGRDPGEATEEPPLMTVAKSGATEVSPYLEALQGGADVNEEWEGETPLMMAAHECAEPDVIRFLVAQGADVDHVGYNGNTALILASAYNPNPAIVAALLEASPDTEARELAYGATALMFASALRESGSVEAIEALVAAGANLEGKNDDGRTPLLFAAQHTDKPEVVRALLAAGADATARDGRGLDALQIAQTECLVENVGVIAELRKAGLGRE